MSGLGLGLGLGLGAHRKVGGAGNKPATFSIAAGFANAGTKRINFSEPVTVTMTGGVTLHIDGTPYQSGATIPVAAGLYHTLTITNPGADAGTITFGKRKQVTYLYLANLLSSVITGDITGMKLTVLNLQVLSSSVAITGDITGMELEYLRLTDIGSSVITGKITGMESTILYLNGIGSSLTYGTSSLNITNNLGIQLLGNTVFATAEEYAQLIHDAANGTWGGKHPFVITAGTNLNCPDWDTVKADVATLLDKAAWTVIPSAWLTTGGGSWPLNWQEYTGE